MVAAVGLVIGPVLGGALVLISWHWVFWFNVPFALGGSLWACAHPPRGLGALGGQDLRRARNDHVPDRANRARLRHLQGRPVRLEQPGRDREPDRRGSVPARLRPDREPGQVADARPVDLQEPPVRGGVRRRLHERAGAVRADVRVRLLLPGRPGRLADRRRDQARAAGARDADRFAASRDLGRSARLARDGRGRHARPGRRARPDDHARARHGVPGARRLHVHRRGRFGDVQLPEHRGDDGHGSAAPPRHRRRRSGARPEHRRGDIDRVRARGRHLVACRGAPCSRCSRGLAHHITNAQLVPFISNMHTALWCLAGISLLGAAISAARPSHMQSEADLVESDRRREAQEAPHAEEVAA